MSQHSKFGDIASGRILILRALQLGDLLCSVPAFRALRHAFPQAEITLLGLPWARDFVKRFHFYLDDFIEFPGFPGLPEREPDLTRIPGFLTDLQWLNFDLAIQMQGSGGITNSLVATFKAIKTAGFFLPGQYCPDRDCFLEYPLSEPEIWRHLRLMEFLGIESQGDDLEFPLYPSDWQKAGELRAAFHIEPGGSICVHPGSRSAERRWPIEKFAAAADGLAALGWQILLTGTEEELPITTAVARRMTQPAVNLAGKTTLGSLGALVSEAQLVLCNDTGISHIAAALRTPSVVLFSASDINRWAPLNPKLHRSLGLARSLEPEAVVNAARGLLAQEGLYV